MRVALSALVGGFCLITVGFWMAWHPLGLIVPGLLLIVAAVKNSRTQEESK